jgi:pimeloyl-ACP methyl ester carboxylesterase
MSSGAHLVGHSYGGLGVMFAAAQRSDATLSLTLLEPGAFALGQHHPDARSLMANVRRLWDQDLPDSEWVVRFLKESGVTHSHRNCSPLRCRLSPCAGEGDQPGNPSCRLPS